MNSQKRYRTSPVLIIAAARSGTKMLRAALAQSPELVEFPYDANYLWKFGHYGVDHDELMPQDATDSVVRFIRRQFDRRLDRSAAKRVLEKSVPNSLRVGFVRAVYPECKIIHLFRDGRDVTASARECWQSSMFSQRIQSKRDLLKKIVEFPFLDAWPYLVHYAGTYGRRLVARQTHVASWGPRFKGIDDAVRTRPLTEVCGLQWARCVERSLEDLSSLKEDIDYLHVRYEDLVARPVFELDRICRFADIGDPDPIRRFAEARITDRRIGSWRNAITGDELAKLLPIIDGPNKILGYV
jgi:sulfotransferase family protein